MRKKSNLRHFPRLLLCLLPFLSLDEDMEAHTRALLEIASLVCRFDEEAKPTRKRDLPKSKQRKSR